jgi:hypothetical protein
MGFLGFFVFNTGVHENHLFVPALLAVVLLDLMTRRRWLMAGLLALSAANLVLFFELDGQKLIDTGPGLLVLRFVVAFLIVALYCVFALIKNSAQLWKDARRFA